MSELFPEQPLLIYPSQAKTFGCEEAVLLSIYTQLFRSQGLLPTAGSSSLILRRAEWQSLAVFWTEEQLAGLTSSLVEQGVLEATFNRNGSITLTLFAGRQTAASEARERAPATETTTEGTGWDQRVEQHRAQVSEPSAGLQQTASADAGEGEDTEQSGEVSLSYRGPAPAFGGSVGWAKPKDDLQHFFDEQEQRHQQLHPIPLDWQPGETSYQMLTKHNIPADFINTLIDEFVSYWSARDRKEVTWDPLFIRLVKKEWVKEEGRRARRQGSGDQSFSSQAASPQANTEGSGERYQPNHRAEKRERITRAIMDINNIDW